MTITLENATVTLTSVEDNAYTIHDAAGLEALPFGARFHSTWYRGSGFVRTGSGFSSEVADYSSASHFACYPYVLINPEILGEFKHVPHDNNPNGVQVGDYVRLGNISDAWEGVLVHIKEPGDTSPGGNCMVDWKVGFSGELGTRLSSLTKAEHPKPEPFEFEDNTLAVVMDEEGLDALPIGTIVEPIGVSTLRTFFKTTRGWYSDNPDMMTYNFTVEYHAMSDGLLVKHIPS